MGQYYVPTLLGKRYGVKGWLRSFDYDNGLKLMEHSYMGNNFVNAVLFFIMCSPMRVAWIGDYSESPYEGNEPYQKLPKEQFDKIWSSVWDDPVKARKLKPTPIYGFEEPAKFDGWYLINHTRKSYVDLGRFFRENSWIERWHKPDGSEEMYTMCIHPLPLLTACGNDRGGGDYRGRYPDHNKVGLWAFDIIEMNDGVDEGYTEEVYRFKEEEE